MALGPGSPGEVTHWELLMEVIEKQPAVFKKNGVKCSVLWFDGAFSRRPPPGPPPTAPCYLPVNPCPSPEAVGAGGRGPSSRRGPGGFTASLRVLGTVGRSVSYPVHASVQCIWYFGSRPLWGNTKVSYPWSPNTSNLLPCWASLSLPKPQK